MKIYNIIQKISMKAWFLGLFVKAGDVNFIKMVTIIREALSQAEEMVSENISTLMVQFRLVYGKTIN